MLRIIIYACIIGAFLISGCIPNKSPIKKQTNLKLTQQDIKTSSPISPCEISQGDFSLPFYPNISKKSGFKCSSCLPDGRTGFISRGEFTSADGTDDIAEWYKRLGMHIKYIDMPSCRKIIISDNAGMTVYPDKDMKTGSTLVISRNEQKACSELIYTGFRLPSGKDQEEKERL